MAGQQGRGRRFVGFLLMLVHGLWISFVAALAMTGVAAITAFVGWIFFAEQIRPFIEPEVAVEQISSTVRPVWSDYEPEPEGPRVIYLNREGAVLNSGRDNSTRNVSSVVTNAGLDDFEVPAYHGSNVAWNSIVSCVQDQFEAYDVEVVSQRPTEGSYTMVMVGGRPGDLANANAAVGSNARNMSGLAPMTDGIVEDAVVFVFARQITSGTRVVCETVAHEVGHVFGLDHEMNARDPMSYLPRNARRSFQDRDAQCGERSARLCADGEASQNSHLHLLKVLGPNQELEATTTGR